MHKHIILHTQYYLPEMGAPQARLSELAHGLAQRGWQVTVLTAMPNYPLGKYYTGYRGGLKREIEGPVEVIRTWIYPSQSVGLVPRLANYFSFVVSSALVGSFLAKRADFILTESPPLFLGMSGFWLSRIKRARWIFNVSDLWPEFAVRLGMLKPGLALRLSQRLEAFCYKKAWAVSGQSKTILANIRQHFPQVKTFHLSNGADTAAFHPDQATPESRALLGSADEVVALYAGLHGLAQGLEQVLEAAQHLQDQPQIKLVLVGDGPEKQTLMRIAAEKHLTNVRFLDPLPKWKMPALVASADISIVPLKVFLPGAVPSKIYEAMASARPLVLVADGEAAEIVSSHYAGLVVKPGDAVGIAAAIFQLAQDRELRQSLGAAGRQAAESQFDRQRIINGFADFLEQSS